jgi:hypothetical protein
VVNYLKQTQSLWLWLHTQELEFVRTGDISVLNLGFHGVDPARSCAAALDEIRNGDQHAAARVARHDWHNCVLDAGGEQIGSYPKGVWRSFTESRGIQERILSTKSIESKAVGPEE